MPSNGQEITQTVLEVEDDYDEADDAKLFGNSFNGHLSDLG